MTKKKAKKPARDVKIRMYNTGFGDCFLLHLPGQDRELKVLIDCGKHTHSTCRPSIKEIVKQLHTDLRQDGTTRIDLLVVTHRHLDHVSGFALDGWNEVEVGEVWMPWTEDPNDDEARAICERQSRRALQLQALIPALNLDPAYTAHLLGYAGNNLTNAAAMRLLHEGFRGNPKRRFLPEEKKKNAQDTGHVAATLIETDQLPGVEIHVLGPSRNPDIIRDMDPPQGESFLRAAAAAAAGAAAGGKPKSPFPDTCAMDRKTYINRFHNPLTDFDEKTAEHFRRVMQNPEMELAATLEKSVNGTSLVLLFKIGRALLLFPGDAQWGTWNDILSDERKRRLLENVSFLKVGHHGSHNATPRRFVQDLLPATACAMIPTDNVKQWPMIPKEELVNSLRAKGVPFVRSDVADAGDDARFLRHAVNGHTVYIDLELSTS